MNTAIRDENGKSKLTQQYIERPQFVVRINDPKFRVVEHNMIEIYLRSAPRITRCRQEGKGVDTGTTGISSTSNGIHSNSTKTYAKCRMSMQIIILAILFLSRSCSANKPISLSRPQSQNDLYETDEMRRASYGLKHRSMFLDSLLRQKTYVDDIIDQDADVDDDDDDGDSDQESLVPPPLVDELNKTISEPLLETTNGTFSKNFTGVKSVNSFTNYTKCAWYTLSHYIPPDSMLYDGIEGFLIAMLLCLILATCYSYCHYCCLTRCGCLPDNRVYRSLLNRRGRKMKIKKRDQKKRGGYCCGCCKGIRGRDSDGKGAFTLLKAENVAFSDDDDHSSLSLDSALSLEYGDTQLHNEYGEITSRWDDSKIEAAAREYFAREEKEAEGKIIKSKKIGVSFNRGKPGRKKGSRSSASRNSRRGKRLNGRSAARSQASSILSSSSGRSLSSLDSSSSGSQDDLEMEAAMMDLELVKRSIAEKGYV
jgi:hypothetical protein